MIVVEDLNKYFGGLHVVQGVSLEIAKGSIPGLIGPNGAGKITLFNMIAGLLAPTAGRVLMDGDDITGLTPHELFEKGLLRTFQVAREFGSMTVRENLMVVPGSQTGETLWSTWFHRGAIARQERALAMKADEVFDPHEGRLRHAQAPRRKGAARRRGHLQPLAAKSRRQGHGVRAADR